MKALDAIEARAEAATVGPWELCSSDDEGYNLEVIGPNYYCITTEEVVPKDAEFIAAARSDVPSLLAALQAVLEVHERVNVDWSESALCEHCSDWEQDVKYPCQTVETIELVLEEKQ